MAGQQDQERDRRSAARRQIIETAQLNCYEARSSCLRVKSTAGRVPRNHRMAFQNAIVDYYYALKPLREEGPIKSWWQDVTLTDQLQGEEDSTGLETLETIIGGSETVVQRKDTVRGSIVERQEIAHVHTFPVLLDIASVLDDAAATLGFAPETRTPSETDPAPV